MFTFLLVVQILVSISIIALVMLQQGKGADMGAAFGSGASGTMFGSQGSSSFFTRATGVLAAVFFINCLLIASPLVRDTGKTASPQQAQDVHAFIRGIIAREDAAVAEKVQILYGGSVKGSNAAELFAMADIDGGLIGGASLDANEFLSIGRAGNA